MKLKTCTLAVFFIVILLIPKIHASEKAHWGYEGEAGPAHWGEIADEYFMCSKGKNQSPIDLKGMIKGNLPPMKAIYKKGGDRIVNNGHTIQINYQPGSFISVENHKFELKQVHFHSPSENMINGHSYPMEAHFVHADKDGNLTVVALMFMEGEKNMELEKAWEKMPEKEGTELNLEKKVNALNLLPHNLSYYRFNGSLTTPPCSEGVRWYVMKFYSTASKEQIEKFEQVMHHKNNRTIQPLNSRIILE